MDQQQPLSLSNFLQQLNVQTESSVTLELNKPALGLAACSGSCNAASGSVRDRFAASKENCQPDATICGKSEYLKDRQPSHGILRKAENAEMEKLQSKFSSLEDDLHNFNARKPARRDSSGRGGPLKPSQLLQQQAPVAVTAPSLAQRSTETAAATWLPAHQGLQPANQQQQAGQPPGHLTSAFPDGYGSPDEGPRAADWEHIISIPPGAVNTSKVAKAASDTFEEPDLQKLCFTGLRKKLQRTMDGATDKTRIHELAGLVKLLRSCVNQLGTRATTYIQQCIQIERELAQQAEATKLSTQTSLKRLEAELASTRQSLAESEREFRDDKAKWGSDMETHRAEVSRLVRELERVTEERNRAREDGMRAEQLRQQLETELKEMRKAASQEMRQASASQSEAMRMLTEEKIAADNRVTNLRDEYNKQFSTLKAAQDCVTAYELEVKLLRTNVGSLHGSLAGMESKAALQSEQIEKLRKEVAEGREQLEALTAHSQRVQQELERGNEERARLTATLEERVAELEYTRSQLTASYQRFHDNQMAWATQRQELQGELSSVTAERSSVSEQLAVLKTALSAAMEQKEKAESRVAHEAFERTVLMRERTNLQHQLEFAEGRTAQVAQESAAVRTQLQSVGDELTASRQLLEEKDMRLAHLEGEFAALKEVLGETTAAVGESGKDIVTTLLSKIATLQNAAASAEAVRRKLHNELVDLRGNIRVYCRVRPHPSPSTRIGPDGTSIALASEGREHNFSYDRVFGPDSTQEAVFGAVSELVQSALDGFHVCIFSYGQTGAGKTHTMQGGEAATSRGIIPRAVEKILATARKLEQEAEWSYSMNASFIEVYNQALRDLLAGGAVINDPNAIKHDAKGGHTVVAGAKKVEVTDMDCATQLIRQAAAARAVDATAMNSVSSRSHSVFMLNITGGHESSGTRLQGSLCLVDLAGSERLDRSLAEGVAKKETCAINSSLSALGDVFTALLAKTSHVPYRNSKLTYLLQPCLGGYGKTLMFVNINPEPASAGESLCSMRFAAKVSGCETGAKGGAKRNVLTLGSGEAGLGAGGDTAGSSRASLTGLPRPPPGGMDAASAAAAKRMSLLPQRAGDRGAGRTSLAGGTRAAQGAVANAVGQKRPAAVAPGNAAKRSKS